MATNYTRTYDPQPTQRVASTDLKNEFQAVENGFAGGDAEMARALRQSGGDPVNALPNAASRANKVLSFDASGHPDTTIAVVDLTTAVTSAGVASAQAVIATQKADIAAAQADLATTNGATQVSLAADQASSAASSAAAAAASYDGFDDRYLGAKAFAPTLDNDGDALLTGALYFNSATGDMNVRTAGGAWVTVSNTASATNAAASAAATAADRAQTGLDRTAAAGSATTANTKAGEAVISAAAAEASRIAASKLNLGNKAAAPTLDNQGAALLQGATYYDTTLNKWRVWTGAGWGDGISSISGVSSVNGLTGPVTLKTVNGTAITGAGDIPIPLLAEVPALTNTSPANAATAVGETPVLTGSAFASLYSATHANTQVQVHTSNTFTSPLYDSGSVAGSVSVTVPAATLAVSTSYFWRMRYKNSRGTWSEWSTATSFTTAATFNAYIATPTATPAAFGDALEGGFYAGMVWNELVQSTTSTTIGTGSKVFTVADMTASPLVYAGQALEVRSPANPNNKMIGTVTGASGTSLTINVTSVGGSGTFTGWSVMAQYRVIVAPKASGENTAIAYKNANTAAPSACGTLSEGRKATLAMVAADTSTVYPAAHWCNNLNIAGKTDWYLPARDELELCWRNLKPTADANYVTADRPTAATPDYMNLGSYGDTANIHGLSKNTSPAGSAHTSGAPAQVATGKNFRTGESEAFVYGSFYYRSASEYSASYAWYQNWNSLAPGYQNGFNKTNAYYVRAVRRSII